MKKLLMLTAAALLVSQAFAQVTPPFGSFEKPFAADSLWNSRPLNPVLGTYEIPSVLNPMVSQGPYSTKAFKATASDGPMTIYPIEGQSGIDDPEARFPTATVTLPRWPALVTPAASGDGHADIFDEVSGKIHSFWQLKFVNGKWTAKQHAWSLVGGKGWPDPSHSYQGARAVGVPSVAGVIRLHEFDDGEDHFKHALAMSVEKQGLSGKSGSPTYIFPATAADLGSKDSHTGMPGVPEGALMMLPPDYQMQIDNPRLQKVVNTLKLFGARVVDENGDTPFFIYVENDVDQNNPTYRLSTGNYNEVIEELHRIRAKLRQVVDASDWIDGNGQPTDADKVGNPNILSMRGDWKKMPGGNYAPAVPYDANSPSIILPARSLPTFQQSTTNGVASTGLGAITWAYPKAGEKFVFTSIAEGNAKISFEMYVGSTLRASIPFLTNGQTGTLTWEQGAWMIIKIWNPANQTGSIRATMVRAPAQ